MFEFTIEMAAWMVYKLITPKIEYVWDSNFNIFPRYLVFSRLWSYYSTHKWCTCSCRVEETNVFCGICTTADAADENCYGGVARRYTKIEEIRKSHDNVLLLDAGDQFQGTLWFQYYDGQGVAHFVNKFGYDAMVWINSYL
jgi:hypothetical protein